MLSRLLLIGITLCLLGSAALHAINQWPVDTMPRSVSLPLNLAEWSGKEVPLLPAEAQVLHAERLLNREYVHPDGQPLWLIQLGSYAMGEMHNFHGCLLTQGLTPVEQSKPEAFSDLPGTLYRYEYEGRPYLVWMLYHWNTGTADTRLVWYQAVLQQKLAHQAPWWQMTSVTIELDGANSDAVVTERLLRFAKQVLASSQLSSTPLQSSH